VQLRITSVKCITEEFLLGGRIKKFSIRIRMLFAGSVAAGLLGEEVNSGVAVWMGTSDHVVL